MSRMGDLANAFDVPDEQSTNVGWANRLGEILTARPQYDETVQYKTASPLVNITEGDIGRATEAAMGVSGGGLKTGWTKTPFNRIAVNDTIENLAQQNRLVPTKTIEEKVIQPHDIPVGSWLTPLVGDRSASGKLLTHVGERELYSPVWMQGGYEFMPEWKNQNVVWGSDRSPSSAIAGRVKKMQAEGTGDVYGVYTPMTPFSVDASHHMSDTVSQLLRDEAGRPIKDISKIAAEKFNDKIRALDPEFPGVMAGDLQPYLRGKSMAFRDKFIKTMNSREARDAGFPDVEQARLAVTHPELRDVPTYAGGQSIGKMTGDVEHGSTGFGLAPHYTYRSKLRGEYEGKTAAPLPQEILWTDFAKEVAKRDPSAVGKIWLTGLKGQHMGQKVTPQWQDTAAEYLRRNGVRGLAGIAPIAMGALAAQDEYRQ